MYDSLMEEEEAAVESSVKLLSEESIEGHELTITAGSSVIPFTSSQPMVNQVMKSFNEDLISPKQMQGLKMRETDECVRLDQLKKLEMSRERVRKLTADPVLSIESTKAKNEKLMLRKINAHGVSTYKSPHMLKQAKL